MIAATPGALDPAAVLAAVNDTPPLEGEGAAEVAVLDRRCARRLSLRVGRDGRMGSVGAEQKDAPADRKDVGVTSVVDA